MKNITVSVDDEVYRRARIAAAERDTSVPALVRRFLTEIATRDTGHERLKRREAELRATITGIRAGDRLSRDDLHAR
jgi:hypothetical protein